jgi:hypothetical protein
VELLPEPVTLKGDFQMGFHLALGYQVCDVVEEEASLKTGL